MISSYSFDEVKKFESFCISALDYKSLLLMENAAHNSIDAIAKWFSIDISKSSFTILAGSGNNGGDAIAVARKLAVREALAINLLLAYEGKTEERIYQEKLIRSCNFANVAIHSFVNVMKSNDSSVFKTDFFIDGLLGIGVQGKLKKDYEAAISYINSFTSSKGGAEIKKIAIDVPSGIASDYDNKVIEADLVLMLGLLKTELFLPENRKKWRAYVLVEIDLPSVELYREKIGIKCNAHQIEHKKEIALIPKRSNYSNKSSYKRCCIIGNSGDYLGAIITAAKAAVISGAGYTYVLMPDQHMLPLKTGLKDAIVIPYRDNPKKDNRHCFSIDRQFLSVFEKTEVYLLGTGFGSNSSMFFSILSFILPYAKKIIIDAEGIRAISSQLNGFLEMIKKSQAEFIFTPHPGEFSHLKESMGLSAYGDIEAGFKMAKEIRNSIIVLKNYITFALIDDQAYFNKGCYGGYAKAGTGDFLAGLTAGLYCLGIDSKTAVIASIAVMDGIASKIMHKGISNHAVNTALLFETVPYVLP